LYADALYADASYVEAPHRHPSSVGCLPGPPGGRHGGWPWGTPLGTRIQDMIFPKDVQSDNPGLNMLISLQSLKLRYNYLLVVVNCSVHGMKISFENLSRMQSLQRCMARCRFLSLIVLIGTTSRRVVCHSPKHLVCNSSDADELVFLLRVMLSWFLENLFKEKVGEWFECRG
jgi:hypothetical protein